MALFPGEMQQLVTPDGRLVTMPSGLATAFPSLQAPQPLAPPPMPQAAPQVPVPEPMPSVLPPVDAVPVTSPSQTAPSGPSTPRGPSTSPFQASDAVPPNTPAPITNDQLAKAGTAGAYNAEITAQQGQRAAVERQGEAIANDATRQGDAMALANAHADQLLEQRRVAAEQNAQALQAKTDEYLRNAKAVADTKIDRSVDHPVLAALSVALTGIGQAMGGQKIDVMSPIYAAIDRKVHGQMQDLEQKRAGLGLQREALGMQRQSGMDRLTEMDVHRLGYLEQAKRKLEEIKQKSQSEIVRTNTGLLQANLDEKSAQTLGTMVEREQTRRRADEAQKQTLRIAQMSNATTIRGQNMQQREADLNRVERGQEKLDQISAQIALAKDATSEKRAKEVREQGVVDPRTGDPLLTPAGADKMADADKEESQARSSKDPVQAQKLNAHAALLRQSAQTNDIATARDAKDREKVQGALDSTHNLAVLVDKTVAKFDKDPSAFDRQAWADLKASLAVVKARYVATLGERVSVKALEAFDDVLSIDADSMLSRFADQGKAMSALKELRSDAALNASIVMKGAQIKSQWKPGLTEDKVEFGGKTAQEVGADARPGGLLGDVAGEGISDRAQERAASRTDAKGKVNSYGLEPGDNEKLSALIDRSGTVGHAEYDRIAEQLSVPLTKDRAGLAASVARKIRDRDPQLYQAVMGKLAAVDPAKAKEIDSTISVAAESPKRTLSDLSDEERSQLTEQRREKATAEDRRKYRKAYDERAAKGTIVRGE